MKPLLRMTLRCWCVSREGTELGRVWSTSPVSSGWGCWGCLDWRRGGSREVLSPSNSLTQSYGMVRVSLFSQITSNRTRRNGLKLLGRFRMDIRKNFIMESLKAAWESGSHHLWKDFKDVQMWHLGPWFSGVLGSVREEWTLILRGLFQPKRFHDSVIYSMKLFQFIWFSTDVH